MTEPTSPPAHRLHPATTHEWLARTQEPIIEPDLPIVDAHHHLWSRPHLPYMISEFAADLASGHHIVATVFVECLEGYREHGPHSLRPAGETETITALASRHQVRHQHHVIDLCAGIVGHADLTEGEAVQHLLDAHIEAGQGRFRGIRQSAVWDAHQAIRTTLRTPPAHLLADPAFRQGFAQLASRNLSFDAWVYFHQLEELADLAQAFPNTIIIVNHVGGPIGMGPYADKKEEVFRVWYQGINKLAACPNAVVKLGGLGMQLGGYGYHLLDCPPTSQQMANDWHPYIDASIQAFGPQRAMFESNFPVDRLSCSYPLLWNAFKRLAAAYSESEKAAMFHDTAARVYRLHTACS